MGRYEEMSQPERERERDAVRVRYDEMKTRGLALNMARGKPSSAQLDLSLPMLDILGSDTDLHAEDGTDCRNYGVLDGIPEAKRLMATLLDDEPDNIIVLGSSSLTAMYDTITRFWSFGTLGSTPWCKLESVKWVCPVPGYDRHFTITESFGIEMIPVSMRHDGPDMDEVERIVSRDSSVKGIWCVPKYSNPTGVTYSDEVVRRLASMECAAEDFRIMWDNAYAVHHFSDNPAEQDSVLDIARACAEAGNENRPFKFSSTSKITFPGAGVAGMAASPANIAEVKKRLAAQAIGHDKLNQLRHARFLDEGRGVAEHMSKHASLMKPKFDLVLSKLDEQLGSDTSASWTRPRGGYFVSFNAPNGTANRIVALAQEAGVTLTSAGATWPYGSDPHDSNIRIAPSLPPLEELDVALDVFCCCVKLATLEQLLAQ